MRAEYIRGHKSTHRMGAGGQRTKIMSSLCLLETKSEDPPLLGAHDYRLSNPSRPPHRPGTTSSRMLDHASAATLPLMDVSILDCGLVGSAV